MAFEHPGSRELDYQFCRYGKSRLLFRGPRQKLVPPYTAFIGGSETFGRFVAKPFPTLVGEELGVRTVNLGCVNAGVDAFANDLDVLAAAARAETTIIQIVGAQNLTNRFYAVHPRRNDRFLSASARLQELYREVDFTEFSFTRHMLSALERTCSARFAQVVEELQAQWIVQMKRILAEAGARTVLLWLSDGPPPQAAASILHGQDPLFIDVAMVVQVGARADAIVEAIPSDRALGAGTAGMIYSEFEGPVAEESIGPAVHHEVARAIAPVLDDARRQGAA